MHMSQCFVVILHSSFVWPSLLHFGHQAYTQSVNLLMVFILLISTASFATFFNIIMLLYFKLSFELFSTSFEDFFATDDVLVSKILELDYFLVLFLFFFSSFLSPSYYYSTFSKSPFDWQCQQLHLWFFPHFP